MEIKDYKLLDFITDVYNFFKQWQEKTGEFKDFTFNASFADVAPSEEEGNALRFTIVDSKNATVTNSNIRNNSKILRLTTKDELNPGYTVNIYERRYDVLIRFIAWSKNYRDALNFSERFMDLMEEYRGVFIQRGLQQLNFVSRDEDIFRQVNNFSLYGVPMLYYIKTNKIEKVYEKDIESIVINLDIQTK